MDIKALVERLRNCRFIYTGQPFTAREEAICAEAAIELTRLSGVEAENARLREALEDAECWMARQVDAIPTNGDRWRDKQRGLAILGDTRAVLTGERDLNKSAKRL